MGRVKDLPSEAGPNDVGSRVPKGMMEVQSLEKRVFIVLKSQRVGRQ